MSYELFKSSVEQTASILNRDALEELDRAFSTDEQLLEKVLVVQKNLRLLADSLTVDVQQYNIRMGVEYNKGLTV